MILMCNKDFYKNLSLNPKNCFLCNNGSGQRRYSVFVEGYNLKVKICFPCSMNLKNKGIDIQQTVKEKIKELTAVKT